MPTAFVLINAEVGAEAGILRSLRKIEGVEEAYIVHGVYDIAAKIRVESMDELEGIVMWRMKQLNKVRSVLTLVVVESTQVSAGGEALKDKRKTAVRRLKDE